MDYKRYFIYSATFLLLFFHACTVMARTPRADSLFEYGMQAFHNKQYELAITYLQLYTRTDTNRSATESASLYLTLSRSYAATGQNKSAYQYFDKYRHIKDSFFDLEKAQSMSKLEKDYESLKKSKAITERQIRITRNEDQERRKNAWIWGIAGFSLLLALLCTVVISNYRNRHRIYRKMQEQMKHDQEIELLKSRLYGELKERDNMALRLREDIQSVLTGVQDKLILLNQKIPGLSGSEEFDDVQHMMGDVEIALEKAAFSISPLNLSEQGLVEAVRVFINNIPANNKLQVSFITSNVVNRLPPEKELNIMRVIQELVHNIFKHAAATQARIQLYYMLEEIELTVSDNGKGMPSEQLEKGIGLQNIRERVQALNGTIHIQNNEGALVVVHIPV